MTEETTEAASEPVKSKRKPSITAEKDQVVYVSVGKHSYPFDIQIKGEVISGQWSRDDGHVEFAVPKRLIDGFEKHFHFVAGNLVAA